MIAASFEGVHEKLARAEQHFEVLYGEFKEFIEREPQPFGISIPYFDAGTGYYVCKAIVTESPPLWLGVILGDVIHNARSALDHLVWQLVVANGKTPTRSNAWPIVTNPRKWESSGATRLKGIHPKQIELIHQGQPHKAGRNARETLPAMLQSLSNADKHQIVHPTLALMVDPGEEVEFSVKNGPGRIVRSEVRHGGRFEHGGELLRALVAGRTDETEVWMEGRGPVEMAFGDRPITVTQVREIIEWVKVAVQDIEASVSE